MQISRVSHHLYSQTNLFHHCYTHFDANAGDKSTVIDSKATSSSSDVNPPQPSIKAATASVQAHSTNTTTTAAPTSTAAVPIMVPTSTVSAATSSKSAGTAQATSVAPGDSSTSNSSKLPVMNSTAAAAVVREPARELIRGSSVQVATSGKNEKASGNSSSGVRHNAAAPSMPTVMKSGAPAHYRDAHNLSGTQNYSDLYCSPVHGCMLHKLAGLSTYAGIT
jgi:hypothetical protein